MELAIAINLFNPKLLINGGKLSASADHIRLLVKSALQKYSLSLVNNDPKLKMTSPYQHAYVKGGCPMDRNKTLNSIKID